MPRHRLMSEDDPRVEVITGAGRRRYWPIEEKLRIVEETLQPLIHVEQSRRTRHANLHSPPRAH